MSAQQRQVVAAVAQAWGDLAARREQLAGLRDQLENEEQAFHGSRIEERIGLRNTIDVLNAEQEFQSTKSALAQAFHDEYLNRVNLLAAMGLLQAELLEPNIQPYRPEQNLQRRTLLLRAMPWISLVRVLDSIGAPRLAAGRIPRDAAELQRPPTTSVMPPAPPWSDLAKYLTDPAGS
ncbi:MAG: TolC family protein [Caulobacteraceae bacterium]|nr:TolC family protein [Caulobacteraceae bacterium]